MAGGVPSALEVRLWECPRNSRGESARSGPVARRAARRAVAAEGFASTAPCGSSARTAGKLALVAEACESTGGTAVDGSCVGCKRAQFLVVG